MSICRFLMVFALLPWLPGCLEVEKIHMTVHIHKDGSANFVYEFFNITSDEKGAKAKREIDELFEKVKKNAFIDDLARDLSDYRETLHRQKDGILNGRAEGGTRGLPQFLKLLGSESYFDLSKSRRFSLRWEKKVLYLSVEQLIKFDHRNWPSRLTFITDGTFLKGTSGKLSKDGKKTLIGGNVETFKLVIGGLGP